MEAANVQEIRSLIRKHKYWDQVFAIAGLLAMLVGVFTLLALFADLVIDGAGRLGWDFFTNFPSRRAADAGILSAWVGTTLVMIVTAAAGVPSIVYGLLALGLFVYQLDLGQSILSAGLTLGLLILPVVIVATREAIRAVPGVIREAAYALGATKWQCVSHHVVPYSTAGIMTGVIIGMARAIGETAPIITIGALTFIAFLPPAPFTGDPPAGLFDWLFAPFTVLPIQMFNWVSRPQAAFLENAAATGVVIIVMTLAMNAAAIVIRYRYRKRIKW